MWPVAWPPTSRWRWWRNSGNVPCLAVTYVKRYPPLPSPPPPHWGRGRVRLHVGFLGSPAISQLVCHAFTSITFAFSGYPRSVEPRNYRIDRRETGTQIGQIGKAKNCIGYQIRKPVSIFRENRKPNAKKRKIRKPQWTPKLKNWSFWCKNRITDLKK